MNSLKHIDDYISAAVNTVYQIHQDMDDGDILVFCADQEEIYSMLSEVLSSSYKGCKTIKFYVLDDTSYEEQVLKISIPIPHNYRKAIFATAIAETSLKIPGIKYVVDPGMAKIRVYNNVVDADIEKIQYITKVEQDKRALRAGRELNGICYQLYTAQEKKIVKVFADPEALRCDLSSIFLKMIAIGLEDVENFNYMNQPPNQTIHAAIEKLKTLKAIEGNKGSYKLTESGRKMVRFPLDPKFSRMIIESEKYGCVHEIVTITSMLSVETIFQAGTCRVLSQKKKFIKAMEKFEESKDYMKSDHIMMLNIYKFYKEALQSLDWCEKNFLASKAMKKAESIRRYLLDICKDLKMNIRSSDDPEKIIMCLVAGLCSSTAIHVENNTYKTSQGGLLVEICPESYLCRFTSRPYRCMYTDMYTDDQDSKIYLRVVTELDIDYVLPVTHDIF